MEIDKNGLEALFEAEMNEVQDQAMLYFQRYIKKNKLELSGELLESINKSLIVIAQDLYAEVRITFNTYGRFLDMKSIGYKGGKPDPDGVLVKAMQDYIKKKELGSFNGIPGYYGSNRMPITSVAINRLAYAMAYSRMNSLKIKRRGEGWYNKGRSIYVKDVRRTLTQKLVQFITEDVSKSMSMTLDGAIYNRNGKQRMA